MRQLRIHDTLSGDVVPVEARDGNRIGIYACGPTVYGRIHVGNARPFVVFSLLKRFLEHEGYDATLVVNVTDVNDKIYDAARERGVPSAELAREMTAAYIEDTDRLELGRPDEEPKATETIDAIVALIQDLVDSGHAYESDGSDNGDRPPPGPEASQNIGYADHLRHKYWHLIDKPFSPAGTASTRPRFRSVPMSTARARSWESIRSTWRTKGSSS